MGIKNFTKIFEGKEIKINQLNPVIKNIAVDASILAYQASLCLKNIGALTDSNGNSTIHINVIIAKCVNFKKNNLNQFWVFDYHEKGYTNPVKVLELEKRTKIKIKAEKKIQEIKETKETQNKSDLFSSDDDDDDIIISNNTEELHKQERIKFSMTDRIINDIKFILDCFDITWCDTPKGYEAEAICAFLTNAKICDAVWTNDTDTIAYGATRIIKEIKIKQKKQLVLYELDQILKPPVINIDNLRKIAVISGCDHCEKSPKIGPKTILKKFTNIELSQQQKDAIKVFEQVYDINNLIWHNKNIEPIADQSKINTLLIWLEDKNFNIIRVKKQIGI